jgi:hypothetical protein
LVHIRAGDETYETGEVLLHLSEFEGVINRSAVRCLSVGLSLHVGTIFYVIILEI